MDLTHIHTHTHTNTTHAADRRRKRENRRKKERCESRSVWVSSFDVKKCDVRKRRKGGGE